MEDIDGRHEEHFFSAEITFEIIHCRKNEAFFDAASFSRVKVLDKEHLFQRSVA